MIIITNDLLIDLIDHNLQYSITSFHMALGLMSSL